MKLSIFTGDAFCSGNTFSVPVFRKSKARFARYKFDIFGWLLLLFPVFQEFTFPPFRGTCYPIVHGSRPTAVRLVMNISGILPVFLPFYTFGNSISIQRYVSYSAGDRSILFLLARVTFSKFCIISILCSDSLLRHHTHQYAHRPLDAHYFWHFAGIVTDSFFIRQRIIFQGSFMPEPYFPAASIHLHGQYVSRMDITRIASSKVPFLTSFRSRSRFSGGSFYCCGTRSSL